MTIAPSDLTTLSHHLGEVSEDLAHWLEERTCGVRPAMQVVLAELTAELLNTTQDPATARADWITMLDEFMAQPNELFAKDADETKTPGM